MHLTAGLFTSETDLCCSIPYWDGAACVMCAPMFPTLPAESAQSVIQVKPTGSALMRIGSALSLEAGLAYRVYVGHRKRKRTLSNTLEILRNSLWCSQTLKRIYLSRHNDTAQRSGFLSGVVGWDFRKRHKPKRKNQSSGRSVLDLFFFSCSESLSFSFPLHNIQSRTEAAVWQTHFRVTPVYQRVLKIASKPCKCAETGVRWHLDSISLLAGLSCG